MSGNQWSDDDDTDEDGYTEDSSGIAQLRKQYKAMMKEKREQEAELARLRNQSRTTSVTEILQSHDVNSKVAAKVAKLIPSDVDATDEAVTKWLEEYGDVFNVKGTTGEGGSAPEEKRPDTVYSEDDVAAHTKVASASHGARVDDTKVQALLGQVQSAKTREEFDALMAQHGVGSNMGGG